MKLKEDFHKYLIALYQDYYKFEMERKDRLTQLTFLPLTIISGIFGFMAYIFGNLPKIGPEHSYLIFQVFLGAAGLCLFISCSFLMISIFGKKYSFLSAPNQIDKYLQEIQDVNIRTKSRKQKTDLVTETYDLLRANLSSAVEVNKASNEKKSQQNIWSIRFACLGFMLSMITFIPFQILKIDRPTNPAEIKILNIGDIYGGKYQANKRKQ